MASLLMYLKGYFLTLRMELHIHDVGVSLVCPGPVYSDIIKNALRENLQVTGVCWCNHS